MTDTALHWHPTRTAVIRDTRLPYHGNFVATDVMATFVGPDTIRYRYYNGSTWIEDQIIALTNEWTVLAIRGIQVRRSPDNPDTIESREPQLSL